jgi:serine/threonine-protein kinase
LYHLFTSTPPIEARERFLQPENLAPPRQINPNLSQRTEKAILWAMSLHPDERPQSVDAFREALLGSNWTPPARPARKPAQPTLRQILTAPREQVLLWVTAGLLIFSFLITLMR